MKTNIRLFVPNTTEALDFEYGLVIHYMQNNGSKKGHTIGLQYYELAEIEPVNNALDIVEQKIITDTARHQSKIDGFTLDSHYALSFDQRFNNRIDADSVRQVWLWLHCKNSEDYPFLLEKITDTEEKMLSQQNQLLVRLWAHADWTAREIQPPAPHTVSNQAGLLSTLKQSLSVHFDQIEKVNREKALAELDIKKIQTISVIDVEEKTAAIEYKPKPIIHNTSSQNQNAAPPAIIENKITDQIDSAQSNTESALSLEEKMLLVLEFYSGDNYHTKANIPLEKFNNTRENYFFDQNDVALALIDTTIFGSAKNGMVIGLRGIYFKNNWTTKTLGSFISWEKLHSNKNLVIGAEIGNIIHLIEGCDFDVSASNLAIKDIIKILRKLIDIFGKHHSMFTPNKEEDGISEQDEPPLSSQNPVYVAIENNAPALMEQPKTSTWWIWPLIIFIGFLINPIAGGVLIALAICWYTLKFIFSSPVLCGIAALIVVGVFIYGIL